MSDELGRLWHDDEEVDVTVDVLELRRHADARERLIWQRNASEMFAAGLVVATFGGLGVSASNVWVAAGAGLIAAGALVVTGVLFTRARPLALEPSADTRTFLDQERAQLEHQASLLEGAALWYVGPFVPGLVLFNLGQYQLAPFVGVWAGSVVVQVAILAWIVGLNRRAARDLRRQASDLPRV